MVHFGGLKILNFNILGAFQNNEYFGGMKKLWIFWGFVTKLDCFGVISIHLRVQNENIFLGCCNLEYFWDMPGNPDIFFYFFFFFWGGGVNSRCWVQAYVSRKIESIPAWSKHEVYQEKFRN